MGSLSLKGRGTCPPTAKNDGEPRSSSPDLIVFDAAAVNAAAESESDPELSDWLSEEEGGGGGPGGGGPGAVVVNPTRS